MTCQSVLGAEGLSLAFRHIVSSLLWYCTQQSSEELLHEVIICVGYFTVNHPDNQVNQLDPELHWHHIAIVPGKEEKIIYMYNSKRRCLRKKNPHYFSFWIMT